MLLSLSLIVARVVLELADTPVKCLFLRYVNVKTFSTAEHISIAVPKEL